MLVYTQNMAMSLEDLDIETADVEEADIPDVDEAGPAILGKEPLIGSVRREQGIPVARDEIAKEFNL